MSSENTSDNDQAADRQRVTESRNENGRGDLRQMGILATAAEGDAADTHPVRRSSMTAATRKRVS